ncbi:hypothetical protein VRY85_09340 [Achromobacter sp. F4_2707]|uniref:hypothetical protein n=1 Tax=Achromobacter sp. F4_2707 TaxID=3114286 RepID=UPI0039C70553
MGGSSRTTLERHGVSLAFGLEWFPLLGNHPQNQARALARRQGASHYVVAAGAAASAGLWRASSKIRGSQRCCSAAAVLAGLHPRGTVAFILPLSVNRQWVVAVHEGAVMTRTDQLYDDQAGAHQALQLLRQAHPGLMVHDENQTQSGLLDTLFKAAQEGGELVRSRRLSPKGSAGLLLIGLLALVAVWRPGSDWPGRRQPGADAHTVDPHQAWQEAMASTAQRHLVHGVGGLQTLLNALYTVPAYLSGWLLTQVECWPQDTDWQCRANYRRDEAGDNQSLQDAALPGWTLSFDPMQGAVAAWSVPMQALPLGVVRLQGSRHNEIHLVSAVQAMLPAFSEFRLEAPEPLPVAAPLDAQQRPVPRSPGIVGYQRRSIHLQAPLRSLSLLLPETQHMSWQRVVLQVAVMDHPSLRASGLSISLSGVLYEIDTPHSVVPSFVNRGLDGAGS